MRELFETFLRGVVKVLNIEDPKQTVRRRTRARKMTKVSKRQRAELPSGMFLALSAKKRRAALAYEGSVFSGDPSLPRVKVSNGHHRELATHKVGS